MASISDLFTNFMRLVNLNFYTKKESNNRFALITDLSGKADSVHSHGNASSSSAGFMSSSDKTKLDSCITSHQDISGKVNTSDIVDNLTTNNSSKVLSAKQGKVLKEEVDGIVTAIHDVIYGVGGT